MSTVPARALLTIGVLLALLAPSSPAVSVGSAAPTDSQAVAARTTAVKAIRAKGPRLRTSKAVLNHAIACTSNVGKVRKRTVLLVHGTGAVPDDNFTWNYYAALKKRGNPYCTVRIPKRGMGDLQHNVEFVVHAIRAVHRRAGRKIAIIGHSQGATLPAYALRIWPDTAKRVADFISYAGAFDLGTSMANVLCVLPCAEAFKQYTPGSNFLTALAKHPLPPGPSYTAFATRYDEIVTPQPAASHLQAPGARNYLLQDLCPADVAEHLLIIAEKPFFQLAFDALDHRGPGKLSRIGKVTCGLDKQVANALPALPGFGTGILTSYPSTLTATEPPLRAYLRR
ncbi:esterase/lipase family protein [Nocardioides daejeonensis]|uniref:esterase/lipase family protein n=1 Tax=Nocardioides daejeonensis TaxID=1046556 RepID=UPI0013A5A12F|nr:alpha/beta fold hydrolase [Nocardioides daejeonensis]